MTMNPIIAQLNRIEQQRKAAKAPLSEMIQPSAPQRKVQREGGMQIQCVRWFRAQYPYLRRLMFHARNESGVPSSRKTAIDAAAGVVPGVADLMLMLPSGNFHALAIELKYGKTNQQTPAQRQWQAVMEAAGYKYVVVRSLDDYRDIVNSYLSQVPDAVLSCVREAAKGADDDDNSRRLKEILKVRD